MPGLTGPGIFFGTMRRYFVVGAGIGALVGVAEGVQALVSSAGGSGALARPFLSDYLFVIVVPALLDAALIAALAGLVIWPISRLFPPDRRNARLRVSLVVGIAAFAYLRSTWGLSQELSVGDVVLWTKALLVAFGVALAAGVAYSWAARRVGPVGTTAVVAGLSFAATTSLVSVVWFRRNTAGWADAGQRPWLVLGGLGAGVALGAMVWWGVRRGWSPDGRRLAGRLVICLLALALFAGAAGGFLERGLPDDRGTTSRAPLILITIDTLRADRLSCYGYEKIRTPHIDELAVGGARFEEVVAQSPWTLPSLASLFTATYPTVNGVVSARNRLDGARTTLAETLSDAGYHTQAFVSNGWLQTAFGLDQGFAGYYHESHRPPYYWLLNMMAVRAVRGVFPRLTRVMGYSSGAHLTDLACRWLRERDSPGFFLWIHYLEPHDPYAPPPPFNQTWDTGYRGRWRYRSGMLQRFRTGLWLTAAEKRHLESLYDGEVSFIDHCVGRILQVLKETGLYDRSLVVVTSDHGEEFWEHGNVSHGHSLHRELLRVPLVMRFPEKIPAGTLVHGRFRLLDLSPTILGILGVPPGPEMQGTNMAAAVAAGSIDTTLTAFGEALIYYGEQKALLTDGWKLVYVPESGKSELYSLATDPEELSNVAQAHPEMRDSLTAELLHWMEQSRAINHALPAETGSRAVVDGALRQQLQAMGYLQ
jgi:arylsulfatase A-like enzyme